MISATTLAIALVDVRVMGRRFIALAEQRGAGCEVLHDRRQVAPELAPVQIVIGAGDGDEIRAEEYALDTRHPNRARAEGNRRILCTNCTSLAHHVTAGQEL